jgi:hypothetical protein
MGGAEQSRNVPIPPLAVEFCAAAMAASRVDVSALAALCVSAAWLWSGPSRFGIAEIQPHRDGTYDPLPGGRRAIVLPARPIEGLEDHDPFDLVAFFPEKPRQWWTRHGVASLLNPDAVDRASILREGLRIWRTPLDWLIAKGEGIVILEPAVNLRLLLAGAERLIVADVEQGTEIERRLAVPPPKTAIFVQPRAAPE